MSARRAPVITAAPCGRAGRTLSPQVGALLLLLCWTSALWATPQIRHWQTTAGSQVYFVEARELPIVDVRLVFDAGSARDPQAKGGLAALVNGLLNQGAGELDATALSFEFERLGAIYRAQAGYDSATVSLRSLSDPDLLQPALRNLRRVLSAPTFPAEAVTRNKQRTRLGIRAKRQSPAELARDAFREAVYPAHPYGNPSTGSDLSVAALSRADVVNFYESFYTAGNLTLALVGDLSEPAAAALAEALSGALAPGTPPAPLPPVAPLRAPAEIKLTHPSSQVHILLGQPGMRRDDPDFFPLYVGNHVLGGAAFVSRLYDEVREQRGLSYSVFSYFSPQRVQGPFVAGLQTRGGQEQQALDVMRETLGAFIAAGPTAAELEAAKLNLGGGFPLQFDSNSKILGYIAMIGFYGLPLDYLDTYTDRINAVTVEQTRAAFERRLDPARWVAVMVGPVHAGEQPN